MQDSENSEPTKTESVEPLTAPSTPSPSIPNVPLDVVKSSHTMLLSFREAIREGTYQGKGLIAVAQGLMFLDSLIGQSQGQLERARNEQKAALQAAKAKIGVLGGQVNEESANGR